MKKGVLALILAGLMLTTTPALAKNHDNNDHEGRGLKLGQIKNFFFKSGTDSQFVVRGTIQTVGTNSFTVLAKGLVNVQNVANGVVTVKVDSNTKFTGTENASSISAASVGKEVLVTGKVSTTEVLASKVAVTGAVVKPVAKQKAAMGEVTAKTDTSVTIKNSITGDTKTITTDADTKVKIDGEVKTVADIQVGDSGWIRFKTATSTFVAKVIHLFR